MLGFEKLCSNFYLFPKSILKILEFGFHSEKELDKLYHLIQSRTHDSNSDGYKKYKWEVRSAQKTTNVGALAGKRGVY